MTNPVPNNNLFVNGEKVELITSYKYFGHEIRIGRDNQTLKLTRTKKSNME